MLTVVDVPSPLLEHGLSDMPFAGENMVGARKKEIEEKFSMSVC